jgi:hypothetical protein
MKVISTFLFAILFTHLLPAQDKADILNDVKGDVTKITITTEEGEYNFEGKDAESLFKKMKSSGSNFVWHSSGSDGKKKVVVIDSDGSGQKVEILGDDDEDELIVIADDIDSDIDGIKKKVKVEMEDGNKKVTVTTNENGEENTEVYEGEDAEKYLEEMKEKHCGDMEFFIEKDDDGNVKKKKIIIEKEYEKETE